MRDIDCRCPALAHDILERVQHLDLRRHIERRRRLVENDEIGIRDQGHGGHQSLQLPAGNLMRIASPDMVGVGQRQGAEQLYRLRLGHFPRHQPVNTRAFDHLRHDRFRRVECGRRALRDIGDASAAQFGEAARRQGENIGVSDPDPAAGDSTARPGIPHQGQGDRGLARSGFADERDDLAVCDREARVLDDDRLAALEVAGEDTELGDFDQRWQISSPARRDAGSADCRSID